MPMNTYIEQWIIERCRLDALYTSNLRDLFRDFQQWQTEDKQRVFWLIQKTFKSQLQERFPLVGYTKRKWFQGIALKP